MEDGADEEAEIPRPRRRWLRRRRPPMVIDPDGRPAPPPEALRPGLHVNRPWSRRHRRHGDQTLRAFVQINILPRPR